MMLKQLAAGFGLRAALVSVVAMAAACSAGGDTERASSSVQEALTFGVPFRVRAIDFTTFNDSDTLHEGTCGSGPVDQQTVNDNGATCGIAYTKPGEWLEYSLSIATAGKFNLVSRVAGNASGKTIRLLIDGVAVGGSQSVPSTGWTAFADRTVNDVALTAGTHTLRVLFETGDTNFNYLDVTPGTATLPQRIEAENYQRAFESTPTSNSGTGCNRGDGVDMGSTTDAAGGCLIGWATAGEWLEYDVTVPQSGLFDFTARLASGTAGRTLQLSVDGAAIGTLTSPSTGYNAFEDRKLQNVSLSAGPHVVRATFVQGDLNLNYLDIAVHPVVVGYSFGGSVNYNALVFQDLSVAPSVAGPLAAGRDITSQGFSYNTLAAGTIGALAGRNFNGTSGNVQRDLVYGTTLSLSNVTVSQGVSRKATPFDFVAEKATLDLLTTNLANFTANGSTVISPSGTIFTFTSTDPSRNIFNVAGSALAAGDQFNFSVPATSTAIVNVTGTTAAFDTASINLGALAPGHLVWNFPQATTLRVTSAGAKGTLLAVNAATTTSSASLDGVLLAASLSGSNTGITWQPFNGSLTVCSGATLSIAPASPQLVGTSLALSATATCADARAGEFHYDYLNSGTETTWHEVAPGFSTTAANWNTSALPAGTYQVRVSVRRVGEASLSGATATSSFILDNPVLIPIVAPTVQTFASLGTTDVSPQPSGWRIDKQVNPRIVGTFTAATFKTDFRAGALLAAGSSNGIYNFGSGVASAQATNYWLNSADRAPGWLSAGSTLTTGGTKSGNLYVALVAPTDKDITSLNVGYDIEKYGNGTNPAGFRIQLYSSLNGTNWTSVGTDFLNSFAVNANNLGFDPAPGQTTNILPKKLTASIPRNKRFFLAWNYTVDSPTSNDGSNAQAIAIDNVSIQGSDACTPSCVGKVCGGDLSNGCGGTCMGVCGGGDIGCTSNADCTSGFNCQPRSPDPSAPRVCVPPTCTALCSLECPCTVGSACLQNTDCANGNTCAPSGVCATGPITCVPNCAGKVCGDDSSDGCGGSCALCNDRQGECHRNSDCGPGLKCGIGAGPHFGLSGINNACWQPICEGTDPTQIPCGTTTDTCGKCAVCQPSCAGKDYGDNGCGGSCGSCSMFQYEGANFKCQSALYAKNIKPPGFVLLEDYVTQPTGSIAGTFSISDSGQAQYTVPLVLPPGRAGMSPFLSLAYNSAGGNGDVGLGWSLTGLPKIASCAETIAQDGHARGISDIKTTASSSQPDNSAALCLDGARLIQLPGTISGQWQYRTEIDGGIKVITVDRNDLSLGFKAYYPDGRIYTFTQPPGTTVEVPAFSGIWAVSRVEDRVGNYLTVDYETQTPPESWGASFRPKTIRYAGAADGTAPDTRVDFEYDVRPDTFDNYRAGLQFRHDKILKTIRTSVGELPVRTYHLDYTPLQIEQLVTTTSRVSRLTSLSECAPDAQNSSTEVCKPKTQFEYQLDWTGLGSPVEIGLHANPPSVNNYAIPDMPLDMNGDGVDDLLMVAIDGNPKDLNSHFELLINGREKIIGGSAKNVYFPSPDVRGHSDIYNVLDYDLDGRDDLLMETSIGAGNYQVMTYKDSVLQVVPLAVPGIPSSTPAQKGQWTGAHRSYILDADGDGVRDIVRCQGQVAGNKSDAPYTWTLIHVPDMTQRKINFNGFCFAHYIAAHSTGSGRQTLLIQDNRFLEVDTFEANDGHKEDKHQYLSISFDNAESSNGMDPVNVSTVVTNVPVDSANGLSGIALDANGDGLTDILISYASGELMTCMGTGVASSPFDCDSQHSYLEGVNLKKKDAKGHLLLLAANGAQYKIGPVLDLNGDGRDDVMIATPGDLRWRELKSVVPDPTKPASEGFSSGWAVDSMDYIPPPATWSGDVMVTRGYAMDVNGDGLKDFVQTPTTASPGNLSAYIRKGHQKLTRVSRDNNIWTDGVEYANSSMPTIRPADGDPLNDYFTPQVYSKDSGACDYGSGVLCPTPRYSVVREYRQLGGRIRGTSYYGQYRVFDHEYTGQRIGINGRGNLGFASHVVKEPSRGAVETSIFDNLTREPTTGAFPYAGREVNHVSVTPYNGDPADALTITKEVHFESLLKSKVITPYAQKTTETKDPGGPNSAKSSVTHEVTDIDEYGNEKTIVSHWSGGGRSEDETLTTTFAHQARSQFVNDWLVHLPATRVVYSSGIANESQQSGFARTSAYTYYDSGLLKDTTVEPDQAAFTVSTHFERNEYGNVWKVESCRGTPPCTGADTRTTTTTYDADRNVFPYAVTDAEGYTTETDRDFGLGVAARTVQHGRSGNKTLTSWNITDGFGRTRVRISTDGRSSKASYEEIGFVNTGADFAVRTKVDGGPDGRHVYDVLGQEMTSGSIGLDTAQKPYPWVDIQTEYNDMGMVSSRTPLGGEPSEAVQFSYDNAGRLLEAYDPAGASSTSCYDGNVTCVVDAQRKARCVQKDYKGRTLFAADPVTQVGEESCMDAARTVSAGSGRVGVVYKYGPFSTLETATRLPEGKIVAKQGFDQLGRVDSKTTIGAGTQTLGYTPFGEAETISDAKSVVTFEYDKLGRRRFQITDPVAPSEPTSTSEWSWRDDFQGRLDFESVDAGIKTTYDYDDSTGLPKSSTRSIGGEDFVSSIEKYDDQGRPQIISYPGDTAFRVENVYDDASGILTELKPAPGNNQDPGQPSFYWKLNEVERHTQVQKETFGNGQVTTRTYHASGLPNTIVTAVPNVAAVQNLTYTFYPNRDLETLNDADGTYRGYTYDSFGRIDQVYEGNSVVADFDYTSFGSIKTNAKGWTYDYQSAAPDSVHSVTDAGGDSSTFEYEATTGALTHRSAGPLPELNVEYSVARKPKKVWGDDELAATTYDYDANQTKVAKHGPLGSTIYIGSIYYRETNTATRDKTHHYLISNGRGAVAEVVRTVPGGSNTADSRTLYRHPDHLGSVGVITDSNGAVAERRKFSLFGEDESASASVSQVGYTGHWQEPEHGLIDMGGRFYDPAVGQFLSSDPFGGMLLRSESFNLKSYVGNNPLRFTDPSGFESCEGNCPGGGGGGGAPDGGPSAEGSYNSYNSVVPDRPAYSSGNSTSPAGGPGGRALDMNEKIATVGLSAGVAYGVGAGSSYLLSNGAVLLCTVGGPFCVGVLGGVAVVGTGYLIFNFVEDGGLAKIATAFSRFETAEDAMVVGTTLSGVGSLAYRPLTNVLASRFGRSAADELLVNPLVYGPSAQGKLAELAESLGGETLLQLDKPMELGWKEFSVQTLNSAAASGRPIVFDLTHMSDIPGVLNGTAFPRAVTSMELRYIQLNWSTFKPVVLFFQDGATVAVPW